MAGLLISKIRTQLWIDSIYIDTVSHIVNNMKTRMHQTTLQNIKNTLTLWH